MKLERYVTNSPDINDKHILYLYDNIHISIEKQYLINNIIKLFDMDNELIVYTYMVKNNIEYIIYKGFRKPFESEIKNSNININELIYTDIIYNTKDNNIRFDISIRNSETNKLILFNSTDFNLNQNISINKILKYYTGTINNIKNIRNYNPV